MNRIWGVLLALLVGVVGAALRFIYMFFPGSNFVDVLVFGGAGIWAGYRRPRLWWVRALAVTLPVMLWLTSTLARLGPSNLRRGIGVGHLLSAFLIPVSAFAAAAFSARRRRRSEAVSTD